MPLPRSYKLVVLGSTRVGKTALIEQLIFGNHVVGFGGPETLGDVYEAVIGQDRHSKERVQIYDTPGNLFTVEGMKDQMTSEQEHFISLADGFMLVYDITSRSSFELVTVIRHKMQLVFKHREHPIVLVGNKHDLNGIRDVDANQVQLWAQPLNIRSFETSVQNRDSLREPFTYIAWSMANPGRPVPGYLLATSSAIVLNSFTHSPQHQYQTSTKKSPSPSSSLPRPKSGSLTSSSSPSWSGSQRHQSLVSEATSVDSRYSGRLYPDDATYGKGGLLGLTDCMSSKQSR